MSLNIVEDRLYQHKLDIRRASGMDEFVYAVADDQGRVFRRDDLHPFFPQRYYELVKRTPRLPEDPA